MEENVKLSKEEKLKQKFSEQEDIKEQNCQNNEAQDGQKRDCQEKQSHQEKKCCNDKDCNCEEENETEEKFVLEKDYNKLKYQLAEVINKYKELEHEFDNYRKRTKEEKKEIESDGLVKAVETILPALDSFKKAKSMIKDESCKDGINMIEKSILDALKKIDVKKIDCIGKEFDPSKHNAVLLVDDPSKESNTVVEELVSGFTYKDKVVKFSQVIVAK